MRHALLWTALLLASTVHAAQNDPRAGVVLDRQGTALVRPVGRERWTPLRQRDLLLPGDWVRTPVRGANALEIRLAGGGTLVLGPGAMAELPAKGSLRLIRGDFELRPEKDHPVAVRGPGGFSQAATARLLVRTADRKTTVLLKAPRWLEGYRASTTDDWTGSLVAKVDGRDVALAVGYHKVTVDIRDQIARTTVEQSFVNATGATLEGVFYFPLPADASVSGFGMWISGELVEADIVEKQKARAIYEDLLRRKKDPGLLEWSGGNLFKARVFPIAPHSEKRIRIRYTQVLALSGDTLRYRYALRSELLRRHPLRALRIDVLIQSATPIAAVTSPTHQVRARHTNHAASAEFQAEEYSPRRDFELVVKLKRTQPLTLIPHRRGDDGYFMLLLSPPDPSRGGLQRDLIPEHGPLDLVLVADTSGSMNPAARKAQADFFSALLASLGPKDRFQLLACDLEASWLVSEPTPVTERSLAAALKALAKRSSLGWTDLDRAFAALRGKVDAHSVVIYAGDGIGTTGDADPHALAARLRNLKLPGTFHAVAPSSTFERPVLEAIASIGGGSVRRIGDDPAATARDLLAEAAQPVIKNLKVRFEGLATARVYPEELPNLPAGAQQIILGRFLPAGAVQKGTVIVTGTLAGQPVRYLAPIEIREEVAGNSFLPRLWARRHIDALLSQGATPAIREEIIAFSEEMGIMTPFTSLLVLESDADRERYGVTRRVKLRCGERFFAKGRDLASTQLLRQQMERARAWRLRLRARMLREIATLGETLYTTFPPPRITHLAGWDRKGPPLFGGRAEASRAAKGQGMATEELADRTEVDKDFEVAEETVSEEEPREPPGFRTPATPAPGFLGRRAAKRRSSENRRRSVEPASPAYATSVNPALVGFPHDLPEAPPPSKEPPPVVWTPEVIQLLASLDRRPALQAPAGGFELELEETTRHPLNGHATALHRARGLVGSAGWYLRRDAGAPSEEWLFENRRSIVNRALRLGRTRSAQPQDSVAWPMPLMDLSCSDLRATYGRYKASLERSGELATVTLTAPASSQAVVRLTIDTQRHLLAGFETFQRGRRTQRRTFEDFVEAGGLWWAQKTTLFDAKNRPVRTGRLAVRFLETDLFAKALQAACAGHDDVIFLDPGELDLAKAKQALHDGRAGFADQLAIALHFAATQQWDKVMQAWQAAEALAGDKPGALWIRAQLLAMSRRLPELLQLLSKQARAPLGDDPEAAFGRARRALTLAGSFQEHERLELLDAWRPGLISGEGQTADLRRIAFLRRRAGLLLRIGARGKAQAIYASLFARYPYDNQAVLDWIRALKRAGKTPEALHTAAEALEKQQWVDHESSLLYVTWTNILWERRRLDALREVCAGWVGRKPENAEAYTRYLSVLLFSGRGKKADAWAEKELTGPLPETSTAQFRARLGAAIRYAEGSGWSYSSSRIEAHWWTLLGGLARRLLGTSDPVWSMALRITGDYRFRNTDAYAALRRALRTDLMAEGAIESLDLDRLNNYLTTTDWGRNRVAAAVWRRAVDRLRARWEATPSLAERSRLAGFVLRLLDAHDETEEALDFLRTRLAQADPAAGPPIAANLVARLVKRPWSAALEDEIFGLVPKLRRPEAQPKRRAVLIGHRIHWAAANLLEMRVKAILGPPAEREKRSRKQLRLVRRTARARARAALAARLAIARDAAEELERPYFELERIVLSARLKKSLVDADGAARELFATVNDDTARERCASVVAYAATRRKATETLAEAAVAFFKTRVEKQAAADPIDWHYHLFRLLVALDRTDSLTTLLKSWAAPAKAESRWRIALGYLSAERGQLKDAVRAFEGIERADELAPADYASLADWYLVLGRTSDRERALDRRYAVMSDYAIYRRIETERYRVARRGDAVPAELDPDVFRATRVLLAKATRPENYLWSIQALYRETKDFRVLDCLPAGVIGRTPRGIYSYLRQVAQAIAQIHEEATCDSLFARTQALREKATHPPDERALLLIAALVERRAAEVQNAPGPHAAMGLDALRAAARGDWQAGERALMAEFLASLGAIPQKEFAAEQLRQLRVLFGACAPAGKERYIAGLALARTLWSYVRPDDALDQLTSLLLEARGKHRALPQYALGGLTTVVGWLASRRRFASAEKLLIAERGADHPGQTRRRITQELYRLYVKALQHGGRVTLGSGERLYRNARMAFESAMQAAGEAAMEPLVRVYCALHRAAQENARIGGAAEDLLAFARGRFVDLLARMPLESASLLNIVAQEVNRLSGPRAALGLLVRRMEHEPVWLGRVGRGGWGQQGYWLARWRAKAGVLGKLEPRLLALVLKELERDLTSMQSSNRSIYFISNSWFWSAKRDRFLEIARKVIEREATSPARIAYVAGYLWDGLHARERAVSTLLDAEAREKLPETGRFLAVQWLFQLRRFGDALPLLMKLEAAWPDRLDYRTYLIRARHETGDDPGARKLLAETDRRFHERKRWDEIVLAALARVCKACGFQAAAVRYYEELIPLFQRTHRNRGIGSGTLSAYYSELSSCYAALGKTELAIDNASAAIVAWGRDQNHRRKALSALQKVLEAIPELDAYVAQHDAQAKQSGLDAPVLRKTLGKVYLRRRKPGRAIVQLLAARDLQPTDEETYDLLLQAYDMKKDPAGACEVLLDAIGLSPRNVKLYPELGRRYAAAKNSTEAERAWTGLAEALPNEAESHQLLAEHWQDRKRYEAAIVQWRQVIRVRTQEPTGWLGLARTQIAAGKKAAAKKTLEEALGGTWQPRFKKARQEAAALLASLG